MVEISDRSQRLCRVLRTLSPEQKLIAAIIKNAVYDARQTIKRPKKEDHLARWGYKTAITRYYSRMKSKRSAEKFLSNADGMLEEYLHLFGADLDVMEVINKMTEEGKK